MNERIKELADKVATLMPGVYNIEYESGKSGVEFTEDALEKFAELIVRECLNKIENEASQYAEPVWAFELVNDIKEHFGVEE